MFKELDEFIQNNQDDIIVTGGITDEKINALIEHSEWMTEVQVRMHLPFLLKNN